MRFGKSGGRTIGWIELGVEAVLVVASVLLALGLNSWRESREHDAVARKALHALRAEIEANRKQVDARLAYHRALVDSLRADPGHRVTLRPAFILTDAWESAEVTGAVGYMEYGTASALGRLDALERYYDDLVRSTSQAVYAASLTAGGKPEGQDRWGPILNDFIGVEAALADQYDRTLEAIGDASQAGGAKGGTGR